MNGHEFYQISFQAQAVTWLYDATSQIWSQLVSYGTTRHYGNLGCQFGNRNLTADYRNGNIYILDQNTYTDNGLSDCKAIDYASLL